MNKQEQVVSDKKFYDNVGYFPELEDLPLDYLRGLIVENEKQVEDLTYCNIGIQEVIDERSELNGN